MWLSLHVGALLSSAGAVADTDARSMLVELKRTLSKDQRTLLDSSTVTRSWVNSLGQRRCCGGPGLRGTQTYTASFGRAVAALKRKYVLKQHLKETARRRHTPQAERANLGLSHAKLLVSVCFPGSGTWASTSRSSLTRGTMPTSAPCIASWSAAWRSAAANERSQGHQWWIPLLTGVA